MAVKLRLLGTILTLTALNVTPALADKTAYDKDMDTADAAWAKRDFEEALKSYQAAIKDEAASPESIRAGRAMESAGQALQGLKRDNEAEEMLRHALKIYEEKEGANSKDSLYACLYLARLCLNQERYVEALPLFKRTVAIAEERKDLEVDFVAHRMFGIAGCLEGMGNFDEADTYFKKGIALSEKLPQTKLTAMDYQTYADYLDRRKKTKQAESMRAKAKAITDQLEKK